MRVLLVAAVLAVAPFASSYAQLPAPPDSELPTGTAVKFWSRQNGSHWISGRLMRFAPKQEEQPRCIGIMADTLSAAVTLASVDSLQILQLEGGPAWVAVSPNAIHARERGCEL